MTDHALATTVTDLAIDFPAIPDLESTFARLDSIPVRRPVRALRWAAAVVAVLLAVVTLVTPVREAVADWFGIGVIRIVDVNEIPPGLEDTIGDLGDPISVEDAGTWPAVLGPPTAAFSPRDPDSVSLVWVPQSGLPEVGSTGVGALLTRFDGTLDGPIIQKGVAPGTNVLGVTVNGAPGYWIDGAVHTFGYLDPTGAVVFDTLRLAGNTLLWEADGLSYRFESGLGLEAVIEVVESIGG